MSSISKLAQGAAIALAASAIAAAAPAAAQAPALTQAERVTLLALKTAFDTGNMAAASAALPAARSAAASPQARHAVAEYQYQIAVRTNDYRGQTDALAALIAGGRIPASQVPGDPRPDRVRRLQPRPRLQPAERAFTAQVAAAPNSAIGMINLARSRSTSRSPRRRSRWWSAPSRSQRLGPAGAGKLVQGGARPCLQEQERGAGLRARPGFRSCLPDAAELARRPC
jgi:hypothetical protein